MKKKILILLSLGLLVGCGSGEDKKDENLDEIKSEISENSNVEKTKSEEKLKEMPIKTGKIGEFFEISILKAQEISIDEITKEKILPKDELKNDKSYVILKYKIKDKRPDPEFSAKPSYKDLIDCKCLDGNIVKKEEIATESKTIALIREIIEVEKIGKKIDLSFRIEDEKLDMTVIL